MTTSTLLRPRRRSLRHRSQRAHRVGSKAACWIHGCFGRSMPDALRKLDPRTLWKNPVMFIVEIGAVFTTVLAIADPQRRSPG